ncbi:MAG: hypothetical protein U0270_25795 [Labilithrix sp.]
MKRLLPVVQKLIAAPCDVPWASMKGDDKTRHCGECDRDVHNLSAMSKDELQAFLRAIVDAPQNATLPCVSMYARQDGTVLLEDCPVGIRARRRKALIASTLGLGGVAVAALTALVFLHQRVPATNVAPEPAAYTIEAPAPSPVVPVVNTPAVHAESPGFVTVEGVPGTVVFEGATRLGTVPLTVQATPGDHTYRATLGGKDEVFALTVGSNSCAMHRLALGTKAPTPTATPTAKPPGWRGRHLAGKMARPIKDDSLL